MRRLPAPALALLAALGGLAACRPSGGAGECPGVALARVPIVLTRTAAQCAALARPPAVKSNPLLAAGTAACLALTPPVGFDCQVDPLPLPPCCLDGLYPPTRSTAVTVAFEDPGSTSGPAAVCTGRHDALALQGTHAGDAVTASLDLPTSELLGGSVLTACSATCLVDVHQDLTGTLARDTTSGAVTGFAGSLVETDTPIAGADCTPCTGPCGATWTFAPPAP